MKYEPKNSFVSPRFCGVRTFMRLPYVETTEDVDFAVIGVPFDTGGSYAVGTRFGPEAIRSMSALMRPYNPGLNINVFDYCSGVDYGDLDVVPGYIEESYEKIEEQLTPIMKSGVVPILLGGDHSVSLPHLRAAYNVYGNDICLVHFDSHNDTNDRYFDKIYSHGTMFRRAVEEDILDPSHSIQVGIRGSIYGPDDVQNARDLGYKVITAIELRKLGIKKVIEEIRNRVQDRPIFLTFDVDFLDPVYAPGTGTPEIGGFSTVEAQELIWGLAGLNFIGFDIVETLPDRDPNKITALAAANVGYEFISLLAYYKRENNL